MVVRDGAEAFWPVLQVDCSFRRGRDGHLGNGLSESPQAVRGPSCWQALAIVSSAVPGPLDQAVASTSAVPGPLGQAAISPSFVHVSSKQAVSSSSSPTITEPPPQAKPSNRLSAQLSIFFQLLLQQYQSVVNPSEKSCCPQLMEFSTTCRQRGRLLPCRFGGWMLKSWQLQRWSS
jgi:hypothetical protein